MLDNVFLEECNACIDDAGHAQADSRAQSYLHGSWLELDAPAVQCSNYCVKTRLHMRASHNHPLQMDVELALLLPRPESAALLTAVQYLEMLYSARQ